MGMYTEIYCKILFEDGLDEDTLSILKYMVYGGNEEPVNKPVNKPDHDLFKTPRWATMLQDSSFYHIPESTMQLIHSRIGNSWYLVGRSDLKNYSDEIELFFNWIKPYCEFADEFIGYSLYEADNDPVIYKS